MVDYVSDVKKYVPKVNEDAVAGLVKHFGIAMRDGADSSFVSVSDKTEVARVRDGFLKKKCELDLPDTELDAAIKAVGDAMKGESRKLRTTFCYLLADRFGKLNKFAA
jgi:Protein of unknown function (DUF2853)